MNLLDLFETDITDIPPTQRRPLTMKDIEALKPKGAYRYRVTPRASGESPKEFLDLSAAEEYARSVGGRVQPIREQADPEDPKIIGMRFLASLAASIKRNPYEPVSLPVGGTTYRFHEPHDKQWFIDKYEAYRDIGLGDRFLFNLGSPEGFEKILDMFASEHAASRKKDAPQRRDPDMDESLDQKKNEAVIESDIPARGSARTKRLVQKFRQRQPQATSDVEALAYELQAAERRDKQEIDKLEKETSDIAQDIRQDLERTSASLRQQRERTQAQLRSVQNTNTRQDDIIKKLSSLDQEQQREIDRLARTAAELPKPTKEPSDGAPSRDTQTVIVQPGQATGTTAGPTAPAVRRAPRARPAATPVRARTPDQVVDIKTGLPVVAPTADQATTPADQKQKELPLAAEAAGAKTQYYSYPQIKALFSAIEAGQEALGDNRSLAGQTKDTAVAGGRAIGRAADAVKRAIMSAVRTEPTNEGLADWFRQAGRNITTKLTADKLRQDWQASGRPIDQDSLLDLLHARKADPDVINQAFQAVGKGQAKGPGYARYMPRPTKTSTTTPSAAPAARTWTGRAQRAFAPVPTPAPTQPAPAQSAPAGMTPQTFGGMAQQLATPGATTSTGGQLKATPTGQVHTARQPVSMKAADWRRGQPMVVGGETIRPTDPRYDALASQMEKQAVAETKKKKPTPTNPDLWSRAKAAARSKFDVYPSAYANAWAAKWYKAHGGGWRMGKK